MCINLMHALRKFSTHSFFLGLNKIPINPIAVDLVADY